MPEHFTKSTVEAKFWCKTCAKPTMHYVHDGRRGGCQVCIARLGHESDARKAEEKQPEQLTLTECYRSVDIG